MLAPALHLARFVADQAPFDSLLTILDWAVASGFVAVEIPCDDPRLFDLDRAAAEQSYCDELRAALSQRQLELVGLSSERLGRMIACHPSHDPLLDAWVEPSLRGDPQARQRWAVERMFAAAQASARLGLGTHASVSGSLLAPYLQLDDALIPSGLLERGIAELGDRWRAILAEFDRCGVDLCFVPGRDQDVHDGLSFERLRAALGDHPRCRLAYAPANLFLQQIDYLEHLDHYHADIGLVRVGDAEFRPSGRVGSLGGLEPIEDRALRVRSPGDGQIAFAELFDRLRQRGYAGWLVLDWGGFLKHPLVGAREGAELLLSALQIPAPASSPAPADPLLLERLLGLP